MMLGEATIPSTITIPGSEVQTIKNILSCRNCGKNTLVLHRAACAHHLCPECAKALLLKICPCCPEVVTEKVTEPDIRYTGIAQFIE